MTTEVNFTKDGGTSSFNVIKTEGMVLNFDAETNDEWIHLTVSNSRISISVDENDTGYERFGSVIPIVNGKKCYSDNFSVSQDGSYPILSREFRLKDQTVEVDGCNTRQTVEVIGMTVVEYENGTVESGNEITTSITVNYSRNEGSSVETETMVISKGNITINKSVCGTYRREVSRQYTWNSGMTFEVRGDRTSENVNITGTCTIEYSNGTSSTNIATSSVTVTYDKNETEEDVETIYRLPNTTVDITLIVKPYDHQGGGDDPIPPGPQCVVSNVTYRFNDTSTSVSACATSATIRLNGEKTTTYTPSECGSQTTTTSSSVTITFEANSGDARTFTRTLGDGTQVQQFTVTINQAGHCGGGGGGDDDDPPYNGPLTIESEVDNNTIFIKPLTNSSSITLSYSTNNGTSWNSVTTSTSERTAIATINRGEKLQLKGSLSVTARNVIVGSGKFIVYGNLTSLTNGRVNVSGFTYLFYESTNLTSAENLILPSETNDHCYHFMFSKCTYLKVAPKLPAKTLTEQCYTNMFSSCGILKNAPVISATTLATHCCFNMFTDCTSLETAPVLYATEMARGCYQSMFLRCKNLIKAPVLSATTLTNDCYNSMFQACSKLNEVKCLATTLGHTSTLYWLQSVSSSGKFYRPASAASIWERGESGIPDGWTIENS